MDCKVVFATFAFFLILTSFLAAGFPDETEEIRKCGPSGEIMELGEERFCRSDYNFCIRDVQTSVFLRECLESRDAFLN